MHPQKKISLYDMIETTFPELDLFELDGDRQLTRGRSRELDFECLVRFLPLSGQARFRLPQGEFSVQVFPTHPGYVCAAMRKSGMSAFDLEAAVSSVAELYFSIDEVQDDERSNSDGTTFLNHLFQTSTPDPTIITLLAADMDLDLFLRRLVAVFRITPPSALEQAERLLRQKLTLAHQDIFGTVSDDCIVCGKVIEDMGDTNQEELRAFFDTTVRDLNLTDGLHVTCGVGVVVSDMAEYPASLRLAKLALTGERDISWVHEHILELIMEKIPSEMMYHFLGPYFTYLDNDPAMYDTVHSLVQFNMDLAAAASDCGVHRNTLVFRLNQLRGVWKINPIQNDNDRFFLILLDYCYSNHKKRMEKQQNAPRKSRLT